MLFYNVDFQIDLWICLKSYTYNSQSVTSVLLALSKKTSTSSMFWISSFMFWTSWNEKTFIIWCFNIAINLKPVTTSVTIIFIKNSYLCLDFCRPHHHRAIYHNLLLSHLALNFLKHKYFKLLKQIYSKFSPLSVIGIFLKFGLLFCSVLLKGRF